MLVDGAGRAWVTGFGRAPAGATADDDRAALERMHPAERGRRRFVPLAGVGSGSGRGRGGTHRRRRAIGPAGHARHDADRQHPRGRDVATVDCDDRPPSGSSRSCTILQTDLRGRPLVVAQRSLVHGWAVRGARGRLTLQVLQPTPDGYINYNHTRTVTAADPDRTYYFRADRSVPIGARFALEVDPAGAVGVRRSVAGARTARFFGPLRTPAREPTDARSGEELLLRVDVAPNQR